MVARYFADSTVCIQRLSTMATPAASRAARQRNVADVPMSEVASEFGVSPNQIRHWDPVGTCNRSERRADLISTVSVTSANRVRSRVREPDLFDLCLALRRYAQAAGRFACSIAHSRA
jgi:transposase-like protein